ncbi:MAG: Holliday junction resolvase [archaeon]|nr:MAG: Holliday junction resolvase [archaeon]
MGNKKRGIAAERELLHKLWDKGFACCRVAGSGSIPEPSCDLLAGNGKKKYIIEVKISKKEKKYISADQIREFTKFAEKFGLQPIVAVKFIRQGWFFVKPEKLNKTEKGRSISLEQARRFNLKIL